MKNTKVIFICLALIMALFFVGLSLNLIDKDHEGLEKSSSKNQQKAASEYKKDSWLTSVNNLLAPFADSIKSTDLVFKSCSKNSKALLLNQQSPTCRIEIKGFSKPAFKKLSLKPKANSKLARLKITYKASGKKAEDPITWPSEELETIDFVILNNEKLEGRTVAKIFLQCVNNCSDNQRIVIRLD